MACRAYARSPPRLFEIGHQARFSQLIGRLWAPRSPNPWQFSENIITKNCRATEDLQLCLKEFCLIHNGFQTTMLQSRLLWNWKPTLDLAKFLSLNNIWLLFGAVFSYVRHWISSWPLNKVCSPCHGLQLLLTVHYHANTLSYNSTLVKLASSKRHFKVNQHLKEKLAHVMNTNIVPFTILDVSKVFLWPHNYLLHWSHIVTSICMYIINITCDNM